MAQDSNSPLRPRSPWRDPWVWGVFALALGLRLFYVFDLRHTEFFYNPQMDALYHHTWAKDIAAGQFSPGTVFFRAPLYAYFLGFLYAITGTDLFLVRVVQAILGAGTAALTAGLSQHRIGRPGSIFAGVAVALFGPLIYYEGELLLVVLEAPLFLISAWALDRAWETTGWKRWGMAGSWVGAAALVRPTILALIPVVLVWKLLGQKRRALLPMTAFLGFLVLVLSPVLAHNYAVGGDLVPVASQGGLNYYLGNNAAADGRAAIAPDFRRTWSGGIEDANRQAELARGRSLKPSEVSRFWLEQALRWAGTNPSSFIALQFKKLFYFWDAYELPNNQNYYYFARLTRLFRIAVPLGFGVLGPLALAGLFLGLQQKRLTPVWVLVPLTLMMVVVAFFVCGRFRASLIPLFAVWAGVGLSGAFAALRLAQRKVFLIYAAVLLVAAGVLNADLSGARSTHSVAESHLRLGIFHASRGEKSKALAHYKSALRVRPAFADAWNNIGAFFAAEGNFEEARMAFSSALLLEPNHPKALGNQAALAFQEGRSAEADSLARRTLRVAGRDPDALHNAAVVLGNLGNFDIARQAFAVIVRLQPENAPARIGEAKAWLALGKRDEARKVLLQHPPESRTPEMDLLLKQWEKP